MLQRSSGRDFVGGIQGNMNTQNIFIPIQPPVQQPQQLPVQQLQQAEQVEQIQE